MSRFGSAILVSTALCSTLAFAEGSQSDDCYDDVKEAKENCTDAILKAGELNNALASRMAASIGSGTGHNQTGMDQSSAATTGTQNGNWAIGECKQERKKMNDKCSDAARRANNNIQKYNENNLPELAKKEEAKLESIKKNYKDGSSYIDTGVTGVEGDISNLQTAGVQGGNAVSSAVRTDGL